ncbi:MAG TPA: cell wall hydrolase [Bacillales bacterium]|nr:cell wall hydrolase [Bacillales bacterium]
MAVIRATSEDIKLLARLMRAEAVSDGNLAMLMVGNVGVNRVLANCLDFEGIRTIPQMVYQRPGGFEATLYGFFYRRARQHDINLARKVIQGQRYYPASNSLWFFEPSGECPAQWFDQWNVGRYKSFCYYAPAESECPHVYNG